MNRRSTQWQFELLFTIYLKRTVCRSTFQDILYSLDRRVHYYMRSVLRNTYPINFIADSSRGPVITDSNYRSEWWVFYKIIIIRIIFIRHHSLWHTAVSCPITFIESNRKIQQIIRFFRNSRIGLAASFFIRTASPFPLVKLSRIRRTAYRQQQQGGQH